MSAARRTNTSPRITRFQEASPIMQAKKPTAVSAPQKGAKTPPAELPTASPKAALAKPSAAKAPAPPAKAAPVTTVTLRHLAAEIAEEQLIDKREADEILTGLVGILVQHLKGGDRLRITGLGVLEVKDKPERAGRNPATGEAITIKASKKIAFRPAKELKEAI
jgi:DNA-binding protein HU-beta